MLLSKKVSDIVTDTDKGKGQSFFQTAYKITAASSVSTHHPCFLFMKILQIIWQMLELFKRGHESLSMTRRQYYRDTTKIQLVPFSKCSLAYFKHQKKHLILVECCVNQRCPIKRAISQKRKHLIE